MPDLTPAAELRAAAATLKAAALGAQEASPTPWTPGDPTDPQLRWIALMDPDMGPLIAQVFDRWAWLVDLDPIFLDRVGGPETLAVARSLNTPTEEQIP
jgi:hypothetical protein